VYVDGSFVTAKESPADYDACWEKTGMQLQLLHAALRDFTPGRLRQKALFGGEWFPADVHADSSGTTFIEFFQIDREGNAKGIVTLNLEELP
jgi:hypothetical protein